MIGTKFDKPLKDLDGYKVAADWCNANDAMIVDQGACYEVVTIPPPPPPTIEQQIADIDAQLAKIDVDSVRPLRAIAGGTATEKDHEKLYDLGLTADELRRQRADLIAQLEPPEEVETNEKPEAA